MFQSDSPTQVSALHVCLLLFVCVCILAIRIYVCVCVSQCYLSCSVIGDCINGGYQSVTTLNSITVYARLVFLCVVTVNLCMATFPPVQLLRKLVLELIHRLPSTDHLRQYVKVRTPRVAVPSSVGALCCYIHTSLTCINYCYSKSLR